MPDQLLQPNGDFIVEGGDVVVKDANGVVRIRLDHETGSIFTHNHDGNIVFQWEMPGNNLRFGGHNRDGDLLIFSKSATSLNEDQPTFHLDSDRGRVLVGAEEVGGIVVCLDSEGNESAALDAQAHQIRLRDSKERDVVTVIGEEAWLRVGTTGNEGDIEVQDGQGRRVFHMNGRDAWLRVGTSGNEGDIEVQDGDGSRVFHFNGKTANLHIGGGRDAPGNILLYSRNSGNGTDNARIQLSAAGQRLEIRDEEGNIIGMMGGGGNIRAGTNGESGDIFLYPKDATDIFDGSQASLHLNGETGDIVLRNADCAEEFTMADITDIQPGAVMVLNDESLLVPCQMAYDTRVVGVVSGAGDYKPGIVLDRQPASTDRGPIALMGKVYCKATADLGSIRSGDLLTTSEVPGHAMKVTDPTRAFGAVIGKALAPLSYARGLIPVLVGLN